MTIRTILVIRDPTINDHCIILLQVRYVHLVTRCLISAMIGLACTEATVLKVGTGMSVTAHKRVSQDLPVEMVSYHHCTMLHFYQLFHP